MFSGIIEEVGRIERASQTPRGLTLSITCRTVLEGTRIGDSIAVDGVCLTVSSMAGSSFSADIQPVTARLSTLGGKRVGASVNLERSVALGQRIGGHYVQGHVDGTGQVVGTRGDGASTVIEIATPAEVRHYVVERGYIAVDGASLTLMSVGASGVNRIAVSLVYHTQQHITLPDLPLSTPVNLEVDVMAKYVERLVEPYRDSGVTLETLRRAGF